MVRSVAVKWNYRWCFQALVGSIHLLTGSCLFLLCSNSIFHRVLTGEVVHAKRSNKNIGMSPLPPYLGQNNTPFPPCNKIGKTHTLPLPLDWAGGGMKVAPLFCLQGGNLKAVIGHLPSLLRISPPPKPLCSSVLEYVRFQFAQTCHSKRIAIVFAPAIGLSKGFVWSFKKKKRFYYYIIVKRI